MRARCFLALLALAACAPADTTSTEDTDLPTEDTTLPGTDDPTDTHDEDDDDPKDEVFEPFSADLSGRVWHGAFLDGATVTVQELDATLQPTEFHHTAPVAADGTWSLPGLTLHSPLVSVQVSGTAIEPGTCIPPWPHDPKDTWITEAPADQSLAALVDVREGTEIHLHALADFQRPRIAHLVSDGVALAEAAQQAQDDWFALFQLDAPERPATQLDPTAATAFDGVVVAFGTALPKLRGAPTGTTRSGEYVYDTTLEQALAPLRDAFTVDGSLPLDPQVTLRQAFDSVLPCTLEQLDLCFDEAVLQGPYDPAAAVDGLNLLRSLSCPGGVIDCEGHCHYDTTPDEAVANASAAPFCLDTFACDRFAWDWSDCSTPVPEEVMANMEDLCADDEVFTSPEFSLTVAVYAPTFGDEIDAALASLTPSMTTEERVTAVFLASLGVESVDELGMTEAEFLTTFETTFGIDDIDSICVSASLLGDGQCDQLLDTLHFGFDHGDCLESYSTVLPLTCDEG